LPEPEPVAAAADDSASDTEDDEAAALALFAEDDDDDQVPEAPVPASVPALVEPAPAAVKKEKYSPAKKAKRKADLEEGGESATVGSPPKSTKKLKEEREGGTAAASGWGDEDISASDINPLPMLSPLTPLCSDCVWLSWS
jgi:hypothetical protein